MKLIVLAIPVLAASAEPPPGMIRIPAGQLAMGRDQSNRADEQPRHTVALRAFDLDATLVTVADFRAFVAQTGHVTTAERQGYGKVAEVGMAEWEWDERAKASWRLPFGEKAPEGFVLRDDFPVTVVSWFDAQAYCRHRGARLPTEAEWEYAARAGREGTRYPWGDAPEDAEGRWLLNFWQDADHFENTADDGWVYFSPVRQYPPNAFGMYDPVGNVWQLTADWYSPKAYAQRAKSRIARNPKGPRSGRQRVSRGGSWWCSDSACHGFGLYFRGKSLPDASFNNVGFRCARDVGNE